MADTLCWTSLIASDCFSHSLPALDFSDVCLRLSATCRTLRQALPSILRRDSCQLARQLVKSLVKEASSACDSAHGSKQYELSLGWVIAHANIPASVIQQDMPEYISVSGMHFAIAERLVRAGARVSYEQLVAAARNQPEAAWICVMAMHRQGVLTEMPALVGALAREWQVSFMPTINPRLPSYLADTTPESLVDMLFIAISALGHCPAPHIFSHIVSAPAAQQIDAATALQLLRAAIKACSNSSEDIRSLGWCFKFLLRLPAVSDIEAPDDISKLLHLGLQCGLPANSWAELGDRLGASNLSDAAFAALLAAAVPASAQHGREEIEETYLECVTQWKPEFCFQHMRAAGSQGLLDMLKSAIAALSTSSAPSMVFSRLTESVQHPWTALTTARQQLSVSSVVELLKIVVGVCDSRDVGWRTIDSCLRSICTLPAAAEMTAEDFKQMLQAILLAANISTGGARAICRCLNSTCRLPAAAEMTVEDFKQIVQVMYLVASSRTGGADAMRIVWAQVVNDSLWNLQATAKVTVVDLKQLMQAAVTVFGNRDARSGVVGCCLYYLCQLEAAAELTAGDLEQLLQKAVDLEAHECISALLWLRLTKQLRTPMRATAAAALVGITARRGDQQAVKRLLDQRILSYMSKDQAQAAAAAAIKALLKTEAQAQQQLQPGHVRDAAALPEFKMTQDKFEICVQLAKWQPDGIDTVTAGQLVQAAVTLAQGAKGCDPARELLPSCLHHCLQHKCSTS